jgi:hypothetical protein
MIQEITTVEDVRTFFNELHAEDLNFHPDDDFTDYINNETREPTYTDDEAALRNHLLEQSFEVCEREGADIYDVCIEIFTADFYKAYPQEL